MNYRDKDNFLSVSVFDNLKKDIEALVQKDKENPLVQKIQIRMNQSLEFYEIEKQCFLSGSISYASAMISLAVVTTRVADHTWEIFNTHKEEAKEIITEVYNIHDILKESL